MLDVRERFERLRDRLAAGEAGRRRVLFLVPPNNKCAGPLYEIVLMLETWLRREGAREQVEITWSTVRGRRTSRPSARGCTRSSTTEFAERGIDGHTGEVVDRGATRTWSATPTAAARLRPADRLPAVRRGGPLRRRCPPTTAAS